MDDFTALGKAFVWTVCLGGASIVTCAILAVLGITAFRVVQRIADARIPQLQPGRKRTRFIVQPPEVDVVRTTDDEGRTFVRLPKEG